MPPNLSVRGFVGFVVPWVRQRIAKIYNHKKSYRHGNVKINNRKHNQDYQYSISLKKKKHIIVDIRGICRRTYLSTQNGISYAKRNSVLKVAFDMPTNVGPTYGMYVGPTSYQRYMSNMSYVGATLRQHVGPTMTQRANLRWANVVCQRWANGVANQNTPLTQRYHAILEHRIYKLTTIEGNRLYKKKRKNSATLK